MTRSGRTRTLAAIGAAFALLLGAPAYAGGSPRGTAATAVSRPAVGECRSLTLAQAGADSDTSAPVDCAEAHTSRVIAVPHLPRGVTYDDLGTPEKILRTATSLCYPAFRTVLGQNDLVRSRTAYGFLFFVPTAQQRADGARWVRCDLTLRQGAALANLPTDRQPALKSASVPANVRRCLTGRHHLATTCKSSHNYRATGSFKVDLTTFPGRKRMLQIGRNRCPALVSTDRDFLFSWAPQEAFDLAHDRTVVCYSRTRA